MWNTHTAQVSDPELPAASLLLGPFALEVLASGLEQEGAVVRGARPTHVSYHPGRQITVSYDVSVEWPDHATSETVVAMADRDGLPPGAVTVGAADSEIAVWRALEDPYLPGLELATDPAFVRALLDDIGVPAGRIELDTRAYWPRWRAVVEVTTAPPAAGQRLVFIPGRGLTRPGPQPLAYLKVVRPGRAAQLEEIHGLLSDKAPVAECWHFTEQEGLLVLAPLPGDTLWECVQRAPFPPSDGRELVGLLERFAHVEISRSPRMTSREGARVAAGLLGAILPAEAERIERFVEALGPDPNEPLITIHGDFHEVQVLVDRGGVCGLLDLDDVGPGHRLDDLAMMAGRFWSFAPFESHGRERVAQYALDLLDTFSEFADPEELHRRVAAVLLARATTPFRSQAFNWPKDTHRAIALAERWLDRSGRGIDAALSV